MILVVTLAAMACICLSSAKLLEEENQWVMDALLLIVLIPVLLLAVVYVNIRRN